MPFVMLPMSRKGERQLEARNCPAGSRRQRHPERKRQKTCVSLGFELKASQWLFLLALMPTMKSKRGHYRGETKDCRPEKGQ